MAMATLDALDSLNRMRYRGDWKEMATAQSAGSKKE
jgi:hypothetical protein